MIVPKYRTITACWTVQHGQQYCVSLSEAGARASLYDDFR